MDITYLVDNVIHKYINDNKLWSKFDSNRPQIILNRNIIKQVRDVCIKCQSSMNMISDVRVYNRIEKIKSYRKKLKKLLDTPLIEQRTEEWYNIRKTMITASDFGDALAIDKFGKKTDPKKIYEKKCGYEPPPEYNMANVFLKWGVMFEPIATQFYETRNGMKVHEFGLVKNPNHTFLGASPDGISETGIMLEIKCPYKRVITDDSILKQYYYQIQGQLDACELDECDFLEVRFDKYENYNDFMEDYETEYECFTSDYKEKGIIVEDSNGSYLYSPYNKNKDCVKEWYNENANKGTIVFWCLHSFSMKRVNKDNCFVRTMNTQLEDVWNNIVRYRNDKDAYTNEIKGTVKKVTIKKEPKATNVGSMFVSDPNEN